MARGIITPWRSHSDLLEVRKQLYRLDQSPDTNNDQPNDPRHHAVQRVMAWKVRGNLPHAVESTALLMDAILHHAIPETSIFSVRAVYSAAFTRFVTGFCDIGRNKERMLEPSSMLEIAKQIDMPVEFVTLRHEATHQELPEVHRLVSATEDALDWLWNVYWSRLVDPAVVDGDVAAMAQFRTDAKQKLRDFRSARREALRAKVTAPADREQEIWRSAKSCADLMADSTYRIEVFAEVLLDDKLLFPSKRE
jgi:ribosomal biogenesis protein LAS1